VVAQPVTATKSARPAGFRLVMAFMVLHPSCRVGCKRLFFIIL
jgi:hypothetical protein